MTSRRRRKRAASALGLTEAELGLVDLLDEILEAMRWSQVLGYANQFLLQERLAVTAADRDRVLAAAADAVERDGRLQAWRQRAAELRAALQSMDAQLRRKGDGRAPAPPAAEADGGG